MESDLEGWAASRATELIARAEAEAVAVLRDALVHAASAPTSAADTTEPIRSSEAGELLWAYCVVAERDAAPVETQAVDAGHPLEWIAADGLAALVSRVPCAEFGPEPLRQNLNQLAWLERVARAHEGVLESVLDQATLVPLRLCTLYESEDGVRSMLRVQRTNLQTALKGLAGREEWAVTLLVDTRLLGEEVHATDPDAIALADELDGQSEAAAYMLRRRLERHVREGVDELAASLAAELRARLELEGIEFVMRPPQNRELSQHEGEMLLNAACLVDAASLERVRGVVADFGSERAGLGASVTITGPWPPYNFVIGGEAATLP